MRFSNEVPLNAVAASTTSGKIPLNFVLAVSLQSVATGTVAGTLQIQVSNDLAENSAGVMNWTNMPSGSLSVSGAGSMITAKLDVCYRWMQIVWTLSSGSGTLTAQVQSYGA